MATKAELEARVQELQTLVDTDLEAGSRDFRHSWMGRVRVF